MTNKKTTEANKKTVVATGTICEARRTSKTFKGKTGDSYFYLSLKDATYKNPFDVDTIKEAYKGCGDKFTPNWVKEIEKGFVNVKSKFDIPVRYEGVEYTSFEDLLSDDETLYPMGASASLSMTIKNGAIYPKALIIHTNGEPLDSFADFE